jgi:hypothetical protein
MKFVGVAVTYTLIYCPTLNAVCVADKLVVNEGVPELAILLGLVEVNP